MAKGIGLIGNFRGKVGNMVGYNLKDSNNKQTQGVRVYQPIVKNPKTYGQAEQRAKLAPINATYRALKMIIDRGQEGKAYGNKSRLAWLSAAMIAFVGGWFEKGAAITAPALVPLTKGSLPNICGTQSGEGELYISLSDSELSITTMGALSTAILETFGFLKNGDQITFVGLKDGGNSTMVAHVFSFIINTASTDALDSHISVSGEKVKFIEFDSDGLAGTVIVSREGENGEHLRSTNNLVRMADFSTTLLDDATKKAAIKSYMTAGSNVDWAEESLQG